jgi:hypothetical protein
VTVLGLLSYTEINREGIEGHREILFLPERKIDTRFYRNYLLNTILYYFYIN